MEELAAWQRAMRLAQELHGEPLVDVSANGMCERRASMRLAQPQARANLAGAWLLDSGASHHMVPTANPLIKGSLFGAQTLANS